MNMKKSLFDRRIPTLAALFILLLIIGVSTYLIQSGIFYQGKAAPDTQPQNFLITNITDSSFTATFTTTGLVDAAMQMTNGVTGNTLILDDRDKKSGTKNKYFSHHITAHNLTPNTEYTFKLIVGGNTYEDQGYKVITGEKIATEPPKQSPLFGSVRLPDGTFGGDTIVVAHLENAQKISAVTDNKGEFILPTNSLRNAQNNSYVVLNNDSIFSFQFFRQSSSAQATSTFLIAQNLPPVTLSEQYEFFKEAAEEPTGDSRLTFTQEGEPSSVVSIRRPTEGEEFVDQRPTFSGTSYPNSSVSISIPSIVQQQVLARADGLWTFQPTNNIPPGNHTLTITVRYQGNAQESISRTFSIFPLGSQVSDTTGQSLTRAENLTGTPTPSPTATPTPSPTITTPTPTPQPTSAPTTPTVAPTSTPTPLPTIYFTPTPQPSISPPGVFENTALLTGFSVLLIAAGLVLLFAL